MQDNLYWLISITSDSARVSLVNQNVVSQGQEIAWDPTVSDSLLKAIDTSLSSQNSEATSNCAFIIPPNWVSDDGKIFGEMLSNLKIICQSLKLKPLGFISYDDAFVESYNNNDSFPASYILVYFSLKHYHASLVYLGLIKKRIEVEIGETFSVSNFEKLLSDIDFSSALPPKIIVAGAFTVDIVDDLSNYNWLSKKDVETFLHLPDVTSVDILSLDKIFLDTIQKQISPPPVEVKAPERVDEVDKIEEVDADALGFTTEDSPVEVIVDTTPIVVKEKLILPKFSLPKLSLSYYWLLPFTLLPFLPILPLFFAKVDITIYQNPVEFSETFDITLDPKSNVSTQTFDLNVGTSLAASGKKEIGEKAKGEVIVFNKSDRSISVNKGQVISDSSGKKFETTNNILLPASTYNLDTGVINMGQVKATVTAQTIGPENNLPINTSLTIKDNPNLLAKSSVEFSGGTRNEVSVVTQADRNKLQENAKTLLKEQSKVSINSQKTSQNTILDSTMVFENQKSTFSREVGEVADTLTLNLSAKISFMYFDFAQKQKIVATLFPTKASLTTLDKNSAVVDLNYYNGKLTMTGRANPLVNIDKLKYQLIKIPESDLKTVLNTVPKYYQHDIKNSLWFLNLLHRLPVKTSLISIIIKN